MMYNNISIKKFWRRWKKLLMVAAAVLLVESWAVAFALDDSRVYAAGDSSYVGLTQSLGAFEVEISDVLAAGDSLTFRVKYRYDGTAFPSTEEIPGAALAYFGSVTDGEGGEWAFDSADAEELLLTVRDKDGLVEAESVRRLSVPALADSASDTYACRMTAVLTYYSEQEDGEGQCRIPFEFEVSRA